MKIDLTQDLGHPADRCAAAFTDPALYPWFAKLPKVQVPEVLGRDVDGDVIRMQIRYRFGGDLSAAARSIIDPRKLTWIDESVHDLGARTVRFTLRPDHYDRQFRGSGEYRFVDTATGCRRDARIEIKVSFPVVGRAVEGAIASGLREHLADEASIVERYLAATV